MRDDDDEVPEGPVVWLVTEGDYSDYCVRGAFSSEAEARRVAALDPDLTAKAIPIYPDGLEPVTVYSQSCRISSSGEVSDENGWDYQVWEWSGRTAPDGIVWGWSPPKEHIRHPGLLWVNGTDEKRVGKVFSDRKAQLIMEPWTPERKQGPV